MAVFCRRKGGGVIKTSVTILVFFIVATITGCVSKEYPEGFLYSKRMYNNYISHYLKGRKELADVSYYKAVGQLQKYDAVCQISRLYISRYLLAEDYGNYKYLNEAYEYAELKDCDYENNLINFLADKEYNIENLSKVYKGYAVYKETGDYKKFDSVLNDPEVRDSEKSRFYRILAEELLPESPSESDYFIKKAYEVDAFKAWTLNIYRDLKIMLKLCKIRKGDNCSNYRKRLSLIEIKLDKRQ